MKVLCYCGRYHLNPENASYVKNGVPMCHSQTCDRVKANRKREHLDLSRVPFFDSEDDTCSSP